MNTETQTPTEQLLSEVEVKKATVVEKKKQKPSATYTVTQMGNIRDKLKELKLITPEEEKEFEKIRKNIAERLYKQMFK